MFLNVAKGDAEEVLFMSKTAIIRVALAGEFRRDHIDVRGRGRSVRTAATRALLNLLRQKPFRRKSAVHVCIELSVISTIQEQRGADSGVFVAGPV